LDKRSVPNTTALFVAAAERTPAREQELAREAEAARMVLAKHQEIERARGVIDALRRGGQHPTEPGEFWTFTSGKDGSPAFVRDFLKSDDALSEAIRGSRRVESVDPNEIVILDCPCCPGPAFLLSRFRGRQDKRLEDQWSLCADGNGLKSHS
jgi:hypothetical protein